MPKSKRPWYSLFFFLVKATIEVLAPTLERMKKRGFVVQEIVECLHEKDIDIKPQTLAKYLNEFRRGKGGQKAIRHAPAMSAGGKAAEAVNRMETGNRSDTDSFIVPDMPLEVL